MALRIPKSALNDAGMEEGMTVTIEAFEGKVTVERAKKKHYDLRELLHEIGPGKRHKESWTDDAKGHEEW